MNITFFIGNGFDLSLGLKTKYSDFYENCFLKEASTSNIIKKWMEEDKNAQKIELWADLEEAIGEKLINVTNPIQKHRFYSAKDELDFLLMDYLKNEQEKISLIPPREGTPIFTESIKNFCINLPEGQLNCIKDILSSGQHEELNCEFVSFNYTKTFDAILKDATREQPTVSIYTDKNSKNSTYKALLKRVFHIHGTLDGEMILGVNDQGQVKSDFLKKDPEFLETIIKSQMNDGIGQGKTEFVQQILRDSRIVCIFGMSIGSTDKMWWEELLLWLQDTDNILIIYNKTDDEKKEYLNTVKLPSVIIRENNKVKNNLIEKGNSLSLDGEALKDIKQRIFVLHNSDFMNFDAIKLSITESQQDTDEKGNSNNKKKLKTNFS